MITKEIIKDIENTFSYKDNYGYLVDKEILEVIKLDMDICDIKRLNNLLFHIDSKTASINKKDWIKFKND